MLSNILSLHTLDPWGWVKRKKSIFEGGYVAYQIKRNEVQNILQAKCLTLHVCIT